MTSFRDVRKQIGCACLLIFLQVGAQQSAAAHQTPNAIQITADLTDTSRHLYHAEVDMPVQPGPATFTTALWPPGSHAPNGPAANVTGLVFSVAGKPLEWHRDDEVLSEFHLVVPPGVFLLHVHLDTLVPDRVTRNMAMLEWDSLMLYPAHVPVRDIAIQASIVIPANWDIATALNPIERSDHFSSTTILQRPGNAHALIAHQSRAIRYAPTNVEQLEDSPVLSGRYLHEYSLTPGQEPGHFLDVAGDTAADTVIPVSVLQAMKNLISEARVEYASRHYREYHFLVTRSNYAGGSGGIEHGQSTNIGIDRLSLSDPAHQLASADLFAHEYTHSWNGKYRRPAQLYQPDFATPVHGDLLWVYEGLTQYLGNVLATRAGLKSPEDYREMLALTAADMDNEPGRMWRSTEDTAVAASMLRGHGPWVNWRRSKDYYADGELLWLDIDTLIRQLTANKRSLDDFAATFLGKGGDTGPAILTYDRAELVNSLNRVAPYDWASFINNRVSSLQPHADLDGLARGGYRLVYRDHPSRAEQILSDPDSVLYSGQDFWYSLGLRVDERGSLLDVRWGSPSDGGVLAPRQTILTVNGSKYTPAALRKAIIDAKASRRPIHLTAEQEGESVSADVDYHGGERYPALARIVVGPAALESILRPRVIPVTRSESH